MEQQSLSLDGKTILSSSSGPTSPEENSKHEESPTIHTSGINFSKSDSSSEDLQAHSQAQVSFEPFKNLLPSPEMLVSFLAKKSQAMQQKSFNFPPSRENHFKEPVNSETPEKTKPHLGSASNNNGLMENSECWRQFQKAAYAHNLDPNVLALYQNQSNQSIPQNGSTNLANSANRNGPIRRKNATRETTSMLKAWLNEHRKNPYPTKGEKIMLAIITKMSLTQVSTWFANARRRLKKENKVTWTIRSGSNFDGEDSDPEEINDEDLAMFEASCGGNKRTTFPTDNEEEKPLLKLPKTEPIKKKIWSLVEMTQDEPEDSKSDEGSLIEEPKLQTSPLPNTETIAKWLEASQNSGNLFNNMPSILAALSGQRVQEMPKFDPFFHLKMAKTAEYPTSTFPS